MHDCAGRSPVPDVKRAAAAFRALAHRRHADPGGGIRGDPATVVLDVDDERCPVDGGQSDGDVRSVRMPGRVGRGFKPDPVRSDLNTVRDGQFPAVVRHVHRRAEGFGVVGERTDEAQFFKAGRNKIVHQPADLPHDRAGLDGQPAECRPRSRRIVRGRVVGAVDPPRDAS